MPTNKTPAIVDTAGNVRNAVAGEVIDPAFMAGGASLSTASTTDVLTGTSVAAAVTPDALAALWEQGTNVASSGTISLGEGGYFHITGTTTITDIDLGTDRAGRAVKVVFDGILTLTHNASTLILPTGANIVTAAGDTAEFVSEGSDAVRCVKYQRASGAPLISSSGQRTLFAYNANATTTLTTEQQLYADTIVANQLATNKDRLDFEWTGEFTANANEKRFVVRWGSFDLLDTFNQSLSIFNNGGPWRISGHIMRMSNTEIRFLVKLETATATYLGVNNYQDSLDLTANTHVLALRARTLTASGGLTAHDGWIDYKPI